MHRRGAPNVHRAFPAERKRIALIDAAAVDAARGATVGAVGDAPDRDGVLVTTTLPGDEELRTVRSGSPLSVAIAGPGLFVVQAGRGNLYSRLGDFRVDESGRLVDGRGRQAVGFRVDASGRAMSGALALAAEQRDVAAHRFAGYAIDEFGVFSGVAKMIDARTGRRVVKVTPIGRLALAIFPAPERLQRASESELVETPASGHAQLAAPGDPNVGTLRPHLLENGLVDLAGDLEALWRERRRAEFQVTLAAAADQCARTALGVVK